jgi:hypothetical protein
LTMYFANWCNSEFGDVFLKGSFQWFCPPTQKPYGLPVAISICLVVCDILLSANDDGQSFRKSMEVLQKSAHGVSAVQGHRILWMLSAKRQMHCTKWLCGGGWDVRKAS